MQAGKTTTFFYLTIERIFSVEWKVFLSPTLPPCFKASLEYKPLIKGASYKEWRVFVVLSFELNDCANLEPYIYIFVFVFEGFSHHSGIIITIEEFQGILYRPRI